MATFSNLGLKLITQGDEAGTWGTSTNTNLDIVDETFQYNSKNFTSDANLTITVANGSTGSSGSSKVPSASVSGASVIST